MTTSYYCIGDDISPSEYYIVRGSQLDEQFGITEAVDLSRWPCSVFLLETGQHLFWVKDDDRWVCNLLIRIKADVRFTKQTAKQAIAAFLWDEYGDSQTWATGDFKSSMENDDDD